MEATRLVKEKLSTQQLAKRKRIPTAVSSNGKKVLEFTYLTNSNNSPVKAPAHLAQALAQLLTLG